MKRNFLNAVERYHIMDGTKRRKELLTILSNQAEPISGSQLARILGVSRQVIVQDIALLRAADVRILPTTRGYLLNQPTKNHCTRKFKVMHTTSQIEDELCTIVDHGGRVLDVIVHHGIYGEIVTELNIRNRQEVYDFVRMVKESRIVPLKELTQDVHQHTVEADSEAILDRIEKALEDNNFICH